MPIISRIGRRSAAARGWLSLFYAILIAGAVTMVYPILLMLATSITGPADSESFELLPRYLYDDEALFLRVISEKYLGGDTVADNYSLDPDRVPEMKLRSLSAWRKVLGDRIGWKPDEEPRRLARLQDYERFLQEVVPQQLVQIGFEREVGVPRKAERLYWRFIHERFNGDLAAMNAAYGETRESFFQARFPLERIMYRAWTPPATARFDDFTAFKSQIKAQHPGLLQILNGNIAWRRHLQNAYDNKLTALNSAWGVSLASFNETLLPLTAAEAMQAGGDGARKDWDDFVRRKWSPRHVQWGEATRDGWQAFLRHRYERLAPGGPLAALRAAHGVEYATFDRIDLPQERAFHGRISADFFSFLRGDGTSPAVDTADAMLLTVAGLYRDHLRGHYGSLDAINSAYDTSFALWDEINPPMAEYDWWITQRNRAGWRWYFLTNNYRLVADLLILRGHALVNTVAFIVLTIVIQLTVNPLCAYALSRFNLPYADKVLIFLLATMAFPAEVTMIPGFLLLRDLNMLNTFAALLLPAAAQGFSIFILKGFFDALPRDVFEAAKLDGCGEWRTFFQILIPLSQPVLAYVALLGFVSAYTSFLFALVICQDSRMWTMMVWIYQLQGTVHESAQIAALVVVMIPTLLVFVFCQRMIMRGVVLPQVD